MCLAVTALTDGLAGLVLLIAGGGLMVWLGAELLVAGASRLAARFGMSTFLIGATVVAFGTSAPEWVVSLLAHITGKSAMSLGNIVGSNVCNLALVLGATALLLPMRIRRRTLRQDLWLVLGGELLFAVLTYDGLLTLGDGLVCLGGFALIYAWLIRSSRAAGDDSAARLRGSKLGHELLKTVAGLGLLVGGARIFVLGASGTAERFGISEVVIGATVVAFGTSLPELVTSVVAAYRGHLDMSVGNLLGSNLFNVLFVGGSLATVSTVAAPPELNYDLLWMLGVTVVVLPLATYRRAFDPTSAPRIDRLGGLLLIVAWIVYVTIRLA